jgi:hypothetical protein
VNDIHFEGLELWPDKIPQIRGHSLAGLVCVFLTDKHLPATFASLRDRDLRLEVT